ncbi:substrate-binding domain-containing protein [Methylorubrum extorquens]|uniref:substrate-binding domain-containing protein n=1 Tax=Methylorubrum extorquens TaxID=408 RepID=UPI0022379801|nr:substrate-binding domain-containing protein [Methylorubrum extorquens]UYW27326.1 substrate-binding domain-containing protein [Methylorubrum extorquens]UYW32787.1 substrate-binding domain-containing protein [Methylorubrum extorquens]
MPPTFGSRPALLLAGIGWGILPDLPVEDDLAAGRLVRLPVRDWIGNEALRRLPLVAAYRWDCPLGPAGRWLFDRLGPSDAV